MDATKQLIAETLTAHDKAISFWHTVHDLWPHPRVQAWIETLQAGTGDYFRCVGLARIAIARACERDIEIAGKTMTVINQDEYNKACALLRSLMQESGISWQD